MPNDWFLSVGFLNITVNVRGHTNNHTGITRKALGFKYEQFERLSVRLHLAGISGLG